MEYLLISMIDSDAGSAVPDPLRLYIVERKILTCIVNKNQQQQGGGKYPGNNE
jgi:hypothetical protein